MTSQSKTDFPEPTMYDTWDIGSAVEDIWVDRMRNINDYRLIFPNISNDKLKFSGPKRGISGEADIVVQSKDTSKFIGIEIKSYHKFFAAMEIAGHSAAQSAYGYASAYIKKDDPRKTAPGHPKTQNLLQTILYLEEFWDSTSLPIRLWKIIYASRDAGPTVEFDVTLVENDGKTCAQVDGVIYPDIHLNGIHERYQALGTYVDTKELPPCDYIPEYHSDYMMTGQLPVDMTPWDRVKHMDWRDEVTKKVAGARTPANKRKYQNEAQTVVKRDWNCSYCPYLQRCVQDSICKNVF